MKSSCCLIIILSIFTVTISQCGRKNNGIVRDIEGNTYRTVLIGRYRWMAENLRTTRFNDGSRLTFVGENKEWFGHDYPACCFYNNNKNYSDTFGVMYNWYAVNSGKLCPAGWRVPGDKEWIDLEGSVDSGYGTEDTVWLRFGLRGSDAGQRLKSLKGWRKGISGTDDFGFSALPGGERSDRFHGGGSSGFWWSSTAAGQSEAYYRNLIYAFGQIARDTHPKRMGFSVRCIRDTK